VLALDPLTTTNIVAIAGWLVSFALGLFSALIVQRRASPRRSLTWSVVSESNLLARDAVTQLETGFGVPVQVLVDGKPQADISTSRLRIRSEANIDIRDARIYFDFGAAAVIYVARYVGEADAYSEKLTLSRLGNRVSLALQYINPKQTFDLEFLVTGYELGSVKVDMAEAGVKLRQAKLPTGEGARPTWLQAAVAVVALAVALLGLYVNFVSLSEVRRAVAIARPSKTAR
jgi:hypothetical protein